MLPKLFASNATTWASMGIGVLKDAIRCEVEENRNGSYELEIEYPISGAHYSDIALRSLIVAKPNYTDPPQPFRVYQISKPLNGVVVINAQHIVYDLSGYTSKQMTVPGLQSALTALTQSGNIYPTSCPFSFSSDMSSASTLIIKYPISTRAIMGGVDGSLIDVFGGEWHYNGYSCQLMSARGANRGVTIRYGKNLTELKHIEEDKVYTAVYPYYYNDSSGISVTLPEQVVSVPGSFNYTKVLTLNLSDEFEEPPTVEQLRNKTNSYIEQHTLGVPDTNITLDFVQLDTLKDRVDLCDTVSVYYDALGVSATAKCIRTRWDALLERYTEVELGTARNSIAATIAKIEDDTIDKATAKANRSALEIAKTVSQAITGNSGGYVIMHDTDNDGEPDEILIMDTPDILTAVNVIRMNNGGIAFSQAGYAGPYSTAWNINGEFVADFIASGQLKTASVEIFGDAQFYWDAANITIVDPNNHQRMIRLGKYDGTNYGLGFSYDGGTTWQTGMDFDGIQILGSTSADVHAEIDGDSFDIYDGNTSMVHLGIGPGINENGGTSIKPYYSLGPRAANSVIGNYSLASGYGGTAAGYASAVFGGANKAGGTKCVAIGDGCEAGSDYTTLCSFAAGLRSKASGWASIAAGMDSVASALCAMAFGQELNADQQCQFVCGKDNASATNALFVVGNGTATNNRRNAFVVYQNGNATLSGTLTQNSDKRLKTIIGKAPDLSGIRAVAFRWKQDHGDKRQHIGYIAQDVEQVAQYLVGEDANGYKTLDYIALLCAKVEQLEQTVTKLTKRVQELEGRHEISCD